MATSWAPLFPELFVSESEFPDPHPAKVVTTSNTSMMERILLLNICFLLKDLVRENSWGGVQVYWQAVDRCISLFPFL
jgi:hypothetical protein